MDKPKGGGPVRPTREQMEAQAKSAEAYWRNWLTFQLDIDEDLKTTMSDIDLRERRGMFAPEQAQNARDAAAQAAADEKAELRSGPTWSLLQREFDVQREFAQQEYDIANPPDRSTYVYQEAQPAYREEGSIVSPGRPAGYYRVGESAGEDTYETRTYVGGSMPGPPPPFTFDAGPEEFFTRLFGTDATPTFGARAAEASSTTTPRTGGGSAPLYAITADDEQRNWYGV